MILKKNNYWFSLIEIIIATSIITITVFWTYKLIWENTKIINNSWEYLQVNSLFPTINECLKNHWYTNLSLFYNDNDEFYYNLWNSGTLNECIRHSWQYINTIDNSDFIIKSTLIKESTVPAFLKFIVEISSDNTKTLTWEYIITQ